MSRLSRDVFHHDDRAKYPALLIQDSCAAAKNLAGRLVFCRDDQFDILDRLATQRAEKRERISGHWGHPVGFEKPVVVRPFGLRDIAGIHPVPLARQSIEQDKFSLLIARDDPRINALKEKAGKTLRAKQLFGFPTERSCEVFPKIHDMSFIAVRKS